ncbi:MAG: nucleotidyltransferase domain-containing protein [Elusimicrobia bacterium]|nr:nucleotidyltransferase domain-containing protein [Elusimicrobiota bacterium]
MTTSITQGIFGRKSRLEVLRCLYDSGEELTGREIARRSGFSPQQTHNELKALVSLGIAERKIAAPAHLFRLNREHWVVKDVVKVVFEKEKQWLDELLKEFGGKLPHSVKSLILFGSASRSQLRPESDIDLLALVENEKDEKEVVDCFSEHGPKVLARYHYPLAPVILTMDEFRKRYKQKDKFAREILRTGRVVRGELFTEIL